MKYSVIIALFLGASNAMSIRSLNQVDPATNTCVNPNKATKIDEPCSEPGNSAWNTHTTSRTAKPADAQAPPYPGHALHL